MSYSNFSDDPGGVDFDLGTLNLNAGYEYQLSNQFSLEPLLTLGVGVNDDEAGTANLTVAEVEIDRWMALSVRGKYQLNDKIYLYAQPSYGNLKVEAKTLGQSVTEDDWEFGLGAGVGFDVSERVSLEMTYDNYDGTDVISAGINYRF